jgi:hypothetical protein
MGRSTPQYCRVSISSKNLKVHKHSKEISRFSMVIPPPIGTSNLSYPIYHHLAEQIHRVRLQMNVSYGVLNGEPQALDFIHHGYQDLDGVRDILLFTDGLYPPRETPQNGNDWQSLVNLYRCGGLPAVRDHVRHLQQTDPSCRKYPRFKQHDDIAAVAIRL